MLPDSYRDNFLKAYFVRAKLRFRLKILTQMNEQSKAGKDLNFNEPLMEKWKTEIKAIEKQIGIKKEHSALAPTSTSPGKPAKHHPVNKHHSLVLKDGATPFTRKHQ